MTNAERARLRARATRHFYAQRAGHEFTHQGTPRFEQMSPAQLRAFLKLTWADIVERAGARHDPDSGREYGDNNPNLYVYGD